MTIEINGRIYYRIASLSAVPEYLLTKAFSVLIAKYY